MTLNGKILLFVALLSLSASLFGAGFADKQTFIGVWMIVMSVMSGLCFITSAILCLVDTLWENEA